MSVIFEQRSAGRAVWHGACGPKAARHKTGRPNLSAQTQAANSGVGAQASTTGAPRPPRRLLEIKIYLPYIPGGKK